MCDKAWRVGDDDSGYLIIKAPTRGKARIRGGHTMSAHYFEEAMTLRCLRAPAYDHLPEIEACRQWERDMKAKYGEGWGDV